MAGRPPSRNRDTQRQQRALQAAARDREARSQQRAVQATTRKRRAAVAIPPPEVPPKPTDEVVLPGGGSVTVDTTVIRAAPNAPEPGPGSTFVMTPGGFELAPRLPEEEERKDADQKALHTRLIHRVERLRKDMVRIGNTHPTLAAEFADYAIFVGPDLAALDVASLWSAGSGLLEFVRAFDTQDPNSTLTPPLEPETLAEFRALLRDHTAFILGFDTGRKLTERVAALHEVERRPGEIKDAALAVLRPMLNTPRLLAGRAQHLIQSLTRALEDCPAKTFSLLVGSVETGKNSLIGFGRALNTVVLSATSIDLALTALIGVPDADILRAAALYLHHNADAVAAFIASDPQLSEWLLWWIERAHRFVGRQTAENNLGLLRTRGQETQTVVDLPIAQANEGRVYFKYSEHDGYISVGEGNAAFTLQFSKGSDKEIHFVRSRDNTEIARVRGVASGQVFRFDEFPHTSTKYTLTPGDRFIVKNEHGYVMQGLLLGIKDDTRGADADEVCFEYQINLERSTEFRAL
jgi:hypothetical protein